MLSQTAEYALRAMSWLALSRGELVPTATVAEKTQVPAHYLAKVLQQLASANLIEGRRGVRGGYRLAKPADQISLLDVINTVEKVERIRTCPLGLEGHGPNLCPLHQRMDRAAKAVIEIFGDATLADLVSGEGEQRTRPLCETKTTAPLSVSVTRAN